MRLALLLLWLLAYTAAFTSRHLLIDPVIVASLTGTLTQNLANITKEPRSPVLVRDKPWELSLDHVWWAPCVVLLLTDVACCSVRYGQRRSANS